MLTIADFSAKSTPFESVLTHSIVSGLTAQALLQKYTSEGVFDRMSSLLNWPLNETILFVGYFVALHDIGKLAPQFAWNIASEELRQRLKAEQLVPQSSHLSVFTATKKQHSIFYFLYGRN